jgi:hypothetical protein
MSPQSVTVFTCRCLVTDVSNGCSSASVLKPRTELLSTVNSTNWVPGWRPFHTNLLVFSPHAVNWIADNSNPTANSLLQTVLLIESRRGLHRKHRSSIIALVSVAAETCLPNRCLETGVCLSAHCISTAVVYRVTLSIVSIRALFPIYA